MSMVSVMNDPSPNYSFVTVMIALSMASSESFANPGKIWYSGFAN